MSDRGLIGDLRDRLSSFRTRLRLFFVLIVIVPMVAVTFIVFRLIGESENGQADARVAARQEAAIGLYYDARAGADRLAAQIGRDPRRSPARSEPQTGRQIQAAARRLLTQTDAKRIAISHDGAVWADVGDVTATISRRHAALSPMAPRSPTFRSRSSVRRTTRAWSLARPGWRRSCAATAA